MATPGGATGDIVKQGYVKSKSKVLGIVRSCYLVLKLNVRPPHVLEKFRHSDCVSGKIYRLEDVQLVNYIQSPYHQLEYGFSIEFGLGTRQPTIFFYCSTASEVQEWMQCLQANCICSKLRISPSLKGSTDQHHDIHNLKLLPSRNLMFTGPCIVRLTDSSIVVLRDDDTPSDRPIVVWPLTSVVTCGFQHDVIVLTTGESCETKSGTFHFHVSVKPGRTADVCRRLFWATKTQNGLVTNGALSASSRPPLPIPAVSVVHRYPSTPEARRAQRVIPDSSPAPPRSTSLLDIPSACSLSASQPCSWIKHGNPSASKCHLPPPTAPRSVLSLPPLDRRPAIASPSPCITRRDPATHRRTTTGTSATGEPSSTTRAPPSVTPRPPLVDEHLEHSYLALRVDNDVEEDGVTNSVSGRSSTSDTGESPARHGSTVPTRHVSVTSGMSVTKSDAEIVVQHPRLDLSSIIGLADPKNVLTRLTRSADQDATVDSGVVASSTSSDGGQLSFPAGGGVLLFGPTGCGKRSLASAFAAECRAAFVEVRCAAEPPSTLPGRLRKAFQTALDASPCVVYLSDVDAVAAGRSEALNEISRALDVVACPREILVIGGTCNPDAVDTTLTSPGRLSIEIYVPPPDEASRLKIIRRYLHLTPTVAADDYDLKIDDELATKTSNFTVSALMSLCGCVRSKLLDHRRLSEPDQPTVQPRASHVDQIIAKHRHNLKKERDSMEMCARRHVHNSRRQDLYVVELTKNRNLPNIKMALLTIDVDGLKIFDLNATAILDEPWPVSCIRRYGCQPLRFTIETGRSGPHGEDYFVFNTKDGESLRKMLESVTCRVVSFSSETCSSSL